MHHQLRERKYICLQRHQNADEAGERDRMRKQAQDIDFVIEPTQVAVDATTIDCASIHLSLFTPPELLASTHEIRAQAQLIGGDFLHADRTIHSKRYPIR